MAQILRTILLTLLLAAPTFANAVSYTLSGGPAPGDSLGNDDEIYVYVNNVQVGYGGCCDTPAISFSANPGDSLRVTVNDSGGGCMALRPLFLHDAHGFTVLDAAGFPQQCPNNSPSSTPWYDKTFSVPAPHAIPTLSAWGMIMLSGLLVLGTFASVRRRRQ
jgi:hypothetical protein